MRHYCRYNHDFRCDANLRRSWPVPLGVMAVIVFVFAWGATVSAQTGFGIQRFSNSPRSPSSAPGFPLSPQRSASSTNSSGAETAAFPSSSVAAPTAKVADAAGIENLFPRKEGESTPIASVVRLIAFEKTGQSFGSGSYIGNFGEYGLILSNWHVVKDSDGLVHIHFPNGFSSFGAVIDFDDEKWDLATIVISKPPSGVVPIPIAQRFPVPGEPLWIAGHGSGIYRLAGGRCVRYLAPEMPKNGTNPIYEIIELSVSARQGDSGGPILNQNGELAGVLFGSDMIRNTAGSYCGRVRQFLLRSTPLLNRLPAQPEVYFASIEKDGPKRQLRETVNFVPADAIASIAAPSVVDIAGSSSSSFGVRSNSRRYVQSGSPAAVSTTEKAPSPPPSTAPEVPPPSNAPHPNIPSPTAPIQKAIWTPRSDDATVPDHLPRSVGGVVVQTGHSSKVIAPPTDPFTEDRAALNPKGESESSHRVIRENLRRADYSKKYAGTSRSPYTLPSTQSELRRSLASSSFLVFGIFFFTTLLVLQAIRLLRSDAKPFGAEKSTEPLVITPPHKRAA